MKTNKNNSSLKSSGKWLLGTLSLILVLPVWIACSGSSSKGDPTSAGADATATSDKASSSSPIQMSQLEPDYAAAGATVKILGSGFNQSDVSVLVGGQPATITKSASGSMSIKIPDGNPGIVSVEVDKGQKKVASLNLVRTAASGQLMLFASSGQVCDGTDFFDVTGKKQVGSKACGLNLLDISKCPDGSVPGYSDALKDFICVSFLDLLSNADNLSALTAFLNSQVLAGGATLVASRSDITCSDVDIGKLIYSQQDSAFYYCTDSTWTAIDVKSSLVGDQGPQGNIGSSGQDGIGGGLSVQDANAVDLGVYLGLRNAFSSCDYSSILVTSAADPSILFAIGSEGDLKGPHGANTVLYSDSQCSQDSSVFLFGQCRPSPYDSERTVLPFLQGFAYNDQAYKMTKASVGARSFLDFSLIPTVVPHEDGPQPLCTPLTSLSAISASNVLDMVVDDSGVVHALLQDNSENPILLYAECASECNVDKNWRTADLNYDFPENARPDKAQIRLDSSGNLQSIVSVHYISDAIVAATFNQTLFYMTCSVNDNCLNTDNWYVSESDITNCNQTNGLDLSAEIDSNDVLHVVFDSNDSGGLDYMRCDTTTDCTSSENWTSPDQISGSHCYETYAKLALDGDSKYVAYTESSHQNIRIASCTDNVTIVDSIQPLDSVTDCSSNEWSNNLVVSSDLDRFYSSSILANSGHLYLSYREDVITEPLIAVESIVGTVINSQFTIGSCAPASAESGCTVQSDFTFAIAEASNSSLAMGDYGKLTLDDSGRLHALYNEDGDGSPDGLHYATCMPSEDNHFCGGEASWTALSDVDHSFSLNTTGIAFTNDGTSLHALFQDENNSVTRYATCVLANDCTLLSSWVPEEGWIYTPSYGASPTDLLQLQYDLPLLIIESAHPQQSVQ